MNNNPWLKNLWLRSAGEKEDWSWLKSKGSKSVDLSVLEETEWSYERECQLVQLGFPRYIITGAKNRMIMGALRYGRLSEGNYKKYSGKYYSGRIAREVERADESLEAISDAINLAYLSRIAGYITSGEEHKLLRQLRLLTRVMVRTGVKFIAEDRNNAKDL